MLTFDPAKHEYRYSGRVLPSVTQIIAPLYEDAFAFVSEEHLEWKSDLGRAVHMACELNDKGTLDDASVSDLIRPYLDAWRTFMAEHRPAVLLNETPMGSLQWGFAGTVDRVLKVGDRVWIVDIKSTAMISPAVGVQLAGYEVLARVTGHITNTLPERYAVQLRPDGEYRLHPFKQPDDAVCFRALLSTYHWKKRWLNK